MENNQELLYDPVEDTVEYQNIRDELESELFKLMQNVNVKMGRSYKYWSLKKRILKQKYNIDWKSPPEMNPGIIFN